MADIVLDTQSFPVTPPVGSILLYGDSANNQWFQKNKDGIYLGDMNGATTVQIAAHSADTYYNGLRLPSFAMQAGTVFEWEFPVSKGAAGVATPVYTVRIGAAGSVADTARLILTGVLQSGAADNGVVKVVVTCRSVGAAGILKGYAEMKHNLATTGLASGATSPSGYNMVEGVSAGFDNQAGTIGGMFIGLSVNPGAAGAWVVEQVVQKIFF